MKKLLIMFLSCVCLSAYAQKIPDKAKEIIKEQYIQGCKELNQQTPIKIDESTTLVSFAFLNWEMCAYYKVDIDSDYLSADDRKMMAALMKEEDREAAKRLFLYGNYDLTPAELRQLMKETGLCFKKLYRDAYDRLIFTVTYNHEDF